MANNVSIPGVLRLDTAADNIVVASVTVKVRKLRWVGATTAAHTCNIMEAGGANPRWEDVANAANYVAESDFPSDAPLILKGLKVATIGSGVLYVYTV